MIVLMMAFNDLQEKFSILQKRSANVRQSIFAGLVKNIGFSQKVTKWAQNHSKSTFCTPSAIDRRLA